jgi:hypothetical protein
VSEIKASVESRTPTPGKGLFQRIRQVLAWLIRPVLVVLAWLFRQVLVWLIRPVLAWLIRPVLAWLIRPVLVWLIRPALAVLAWLFRPVLVWLIRPVLVWLIRPALAWLQQRPALRDHLGASLLATALFVAWFCRALFGGYMYGALPKHEQMGVIWYNAWVEQKELPVTEREPNVLDADHHFLYELDANAAKRDLQAGHLPYFDFNRLLGVPLWGSIIYDFGNPLNLLLKYFSFSQVHLFKMFLYMLLAANGFVLVLRELGATTSTGWAVATTTYLGTNYAIGFIHWSSAFGVICGAPLLFGLMLRFLRTGSGRVFLGLCLTLAYLIVMQCSQMVVHLGIYCAAAVAFLAVYSYREWKQLLPRIALLGFAAVCAAAMCFEILMQAGLTASEIARNAGSFTECGYPYLEIPQVTKAYSTFFFGNIRYPAFGWNDPFLPWAAMLALFTVFARPEDRLRAVRVLGWLLVLFFVFFFVGWLDAPLYLLGKLYAPNPMGFRGLLTLNLPIAAAAGLGMEYVVSAAATTFIRRMAYGGILVAVVLGSVAATVSDPFALRCFFAASGQLFDSYVKSPGFWLILGGNVLWLVAFVPGAFRSFKRAAVLAGAVSICIGMGTSRMPFYAEGDVSRISCGDLADINTPRVVRLVPSAEFFFFSNLQNRSVEIRFVHDSPLSAMGLKALTGYHTSMSRQELMVFNSLESEGYLDARDKRTMPGLSFGLYHCFLDAQAVVEGNDLRPEKELILELLGVEYVIAGMQLARMNPQPPYDFTKWPKLSLGTTTISHFAEGVREEKIRALFAGKYPRDMVANLRYNLKPFHLEPTDDGRGYRASLSGTAGTIIVPYHFGRFFKVTLDGKEIPEKDDLGLCIVETTADSKVLEIRPQSEGIAARLCGGLFAGCLLAFAGYLICNWLPKAGPIAAESPSAVVDSGVQSEGDNAGAGTPQPDVAAHGANPPADNRQPTETAEGK